MGKYEAGKKSSCEGCGAELHPVYMTVHRLECEQYRSWSVSLPHHCRKGCGMGFDAPRSRANHERVCTGVVAPVLTTCRLCGDRYAETLAVHLNDCKGPTVIPVLADDVPLPEPDGCVCGYRGASVPAAYAHRVQCSHWWVYSKRLSHGCEGCDRRFVDVFSKRTHARACPAWLRWREQQAVVESEALTRSCPSCGKKVRGPQLGVHVKTCPGSFSREDWRQYYAAARAVRAKLHLAALYSADEEAGRDYVVCRICHGRFRSLLWHLPQTHQMTVEEYKRQHPGRILSDRTLTRRIVTWRVKYGTDHPIQVPANKIARGLKRVQTMMERYGAPSVVQAGLVPTKMTTPERVVVGFGLEGLHYTGDHRYWVNVRTASGGFRPRNPDFVVYDEARRARVASGESENEVRTRKVVEVFGTYWHGEARTGLSRESYTSLRETEYASVGVQVLVLWEDEINEGPDQVRERLVKFLSSLPV